MKKVIIFFILIFITKTYTFSNENKPKVSIIVSLEQADDFLYGFLEGISKQTIFNDCEFILIDAPNFHRAGSDLPDSKYLKKFSNIRHLKLNKDANFYTLLNLGIKLAKADYVANFNIQDRFNHKLLETHYNELKQNPNIDLVYSGFFITYNKNETFEKNNYRWVVDSKEFAPVNMQKYLPGPAPVWRKSVHEKYGYFDKTFKYSANWQMWLRAVSKGSKFKKIPGQYTLYFSDINQENNVNKDNENKLIIKNYEFVWKQPLNLDEKPIINKKFVIIIPSYNNKYWYQRNLNSIFLQNYQNYKVIYIDDCSKDNTSELVEKYVQFLGKSEKVNLIKNKERKGALENLYNAIHSCAPDEIIVTLDGDDWFSNEHVLNYLNNIYQDEKVWLTYGQFANYPSCDIGWAQQIPQAIIEQNKIREHSWITTHLRTFYAGLFQKIKKEDLLHQGKFFQMAWDLAFMFPMIEMAGKNTRFISDVLYIYNRATPINDEKVDPGLQNYLTQIIRGKEKYKIIENFNKTKQNKKIYIFADQWGSLFDLNSVHNRDNCLQPTYLLKKHFEKLGLELIHTQNIENLDDSDLVICFNFSINNLNKLKLYPKEKLILFLWEPPTTALINYDSQYHDYFSKVYTFCDDLIDNKKYFKFYYPVLNPIISELKDFENKKLCTMICMNKNSSFKNELYSERKKIIQFFEDLTEPDFDFYGKYWNKSEFKNYKGEIGTKNSLLKNYKFCICYENTKDCNGYITEKIFDCFQAGCVPIYWGAPNIENYIPNNCFIKRENFTSDEELYLFLKNMSKLEYDNYIENIKNYLKSDLAHLYSTDNFIKIFRRACQVN